MDITLLEKIKAICAENSMIEPGFFILNKSIQGLEYGITIGVPLSRTILKEVLDLSRPTHSYFHHYRTVNTLLDQIMLKIGLLLQENGYNYLPIGASQSIPTQDDPKGFHGRFSHKEGACLSGLGYMGTNGLFLHKKYGPALRLGTILTDFQGVKENPPRLENTRCKGCLKCYHSCPSKAILGNVFDENKCKTDEWQLINPQICSDFMKKEYKLIGRGAVCGICIGVCMENFIL